MPADATMSGNTGMPVNAAMPANAAIPENTLMPMLLTNWKKKCTYGNVVESELLRVRVATLLRNICANILRVMSQGNTCC